MTSACEFLRYSVTTAATFLAGMVAVGVRVRRERETKPTRRDGWASPGELAHAQRPAVVLRAEPQQERGRPLRPRLGPGVGGGAVGPRLPEHVGVDHAGV